MDVLCQCWTVKVPAPPGQTVIDCKVHLEVIPGYAYQHSFPSHFPQYKEAAPPRRTEISINQTGHNGAWMCQSGNECSAERIVPGLLYVHIHGSDWCVGGQSTMSTVRMPCKNSNHRMWCSLFQCSPLGIGFDDQDKCGAELQVLMKYMSSQDWIWIIHFNGAKYTTLHLSHASLYANSRL